MSEGGTRRDDGCGGGPIRRTVTVASELGLHARPAANFVKLAETFDAEITVECKAMSVSGLSILGLMMLAAGAGTELTIVADGPDAEAALDALAALLSESEDAADRHD